MQGNMMDVQLTIPTILERMRTQYAGREVVSLMVAGRDEKGQPIPHKHRTTYGAVADRALRLASAMQGLGLNPGDRVATLCVNSFRHLEAYMGVPSAGLVLHTVNIRLHPEQVVWILNHAEDRVLIIENVFAAMIPAIRAACPQIERVFVMGPLPQAIPGAEDYDAFVMAHEPLARYPDLEENAPAAMCYTSGTTGNPKGVIYTHRSTVLHSLASAPKDALGVSEADSVLAIVPMFHVNAWGLPYTCAMYGAKQVFAGVFSDGPSIARLLQEEEVTITAGVPTIWMGLLAELDRAKAEGTPYDLSRLQTLISGGSASPESMLRAFEDRHGLRMLQAWGMTETHPLGTASNVPVGVDPTSDEGYALRAKQGRAVPLVELALLSDDGQLLPHDGKTMGRLIIRAPWVASSYFKGEGQSNFFTLDDGKLWFDTGDIVTIDERGFMHIQDRAKDLIKSGGEWISSVDLENAIMAHPAVAQCAVIAMDDPKWDERPLAVVVPRPGQTVSHEELVEFITPKFARWWLPDATVITESLPIGATGKFLKRELRDQYRGYKAGSQATSDA
ncbi:long-chain fatty acid--CoA ligase [Deinococcus deserti]|uniref:Putative Medium-chain-fatty-acid--CoA ligase (Medium-chain acyl-CoA synthetase) n=1 Tax=Deinococcus deserti (strain DSM 17065 / CIP 109153 / LMG 22923 / VCD115) TaxID=546414 RepID=C1D003_DEIDV|nr:long-chain fatty acid--CoA ligase [Deinococcus deserti]ACO45255.1 putative Medium-chain-fatty-acid--CoA ligase (Medium-chain acyl- CoA synthetase) [Deinococcus deserti VCD115]